MQKPFAITQGDAAGIGPEIIAKAFQDAPEAMRGCFVAGSVAVMRRAAGWLGGLPVACLEQADEALHAPPRCIPVLPVVQTPSGVPEPGRVSCHSPAAQGGAGRRRRAIQPLSRPH